MNNNNNNKEEEEEEDNYEMTPQIIQELCRQNKLYSIPEINEVLYLHFEGFTKIQHLDPYINVKVLWLNDNQLSKIEGLSSLKQLESLYLQNNFISKIEGLEELQKLHLLNLSHNYIQNIEGLEHCQQLQTLDVDHNRLDTINSIQGILQCQSLEILNISDNKLYEIGIIEILSHMSQLRVLRLENNPIVDQCQHYRRSVIHLCKILTYLDDSTVDTNERLLVESYYEGGHQREQFIRQRIKEEKRRKEEISFREVRRMQRERLLSKGGNIDEYPELKSSDDDEEQYCNDNSNEIESVD